MNHDRIRLSANADDHGGADERVHVLVSRLADGEGSPEDWSEFAAHAGKQVGAWEQLALAQRDHAALSVAVGATLCAAERVELPGEEAVRRFGGAHVAGGLGEHQRAHWSRVRTWGGWAVAAALLLAWTLGPMGTTMRGNAGAVKQQNAGIIPDGWVEVKTPEDALNLYKKMGAESEEFKVLGELPQRVLLDKRERPDGKIELTYLRQMIEKTVTDQMYAFPAADELGRPVAVPMKPEATPEAPQ